MLLTIFFFFILMSLVIIPHLREGRCEVSLTAHEVQIFQDIISVQYQGLETSYLSRNMKRSDYFCTMSLFLPKKSGHYSSIKYLLNLLPR